MKLEAPARVFATELYNELEVAALRLRSELQAVKTAAVQTGTLAAIILGSGLTVACLCADALTAAQVYTKLQDSPLVKTVIKTIGPDYWGLLKEYCKLRNRSASCVMSPLDISPS